MSLSARIAWRYLRRPTDRLVSAVGAVSVLGLVIGVMALVISMALMTGYRDDLQQKLLGGNAEVFVYAIGSPIEHPAPLLASILEVPGVAQASPVVFQQAVVTTEKNTTGAEVMVKGIEASRGEGSPMLAKVIGPSRRFAAPDGTSGISVGRHMASRLGVTPGSPVSITVPNERAGSFLPRTVSFVVTNVFETGFYEYDARWMFIDLADAQRLAGSPGANLVEVKLDPGADLEKVSDDISRRTLNRYAVSDWRDMNRQLFSMLKLQQLVLFIVIGLIVFVSTFNIVSTLIMTVHEKRREIGILASMGERAANIRRIFLWYGTLVGLAGTVTGIVLGVLISWVVTRFELLSFPPEIAEVYFVSSIPFITRPLDLVVIALFTMGVSFVATFVPSARAARLNPVDALRHE